jgi:hypothetical protein
MSATPPGWAEALLRLFLEPGDFESVSGDLLEEYRDSIHPFRGQRRADVWYVMQVLGFVSRGARAWAVLFGAAFVTRTALDWLAPPLNFHTRSTVSTVLGVGILVAAGLWASWRSGSFVAGTVAGVTATAIGAVISVIGAAGLLAIWHDAETMAAIRGSGGLGEVFGLPLVMILPGAVLGTIGGVVGATIKRLGSTSRSSWR